MAFFMFHFGYTVRSEKYVGWLRGTQWEIYRLATGYAVRGTRNAACMPRSLSLKAKITHFDLLYKNE